MKKILTIIFYLVFFSLYSNAQVVNIAYKPIDEQTILNPRITSSILETSSKAGKEFGFNASTSEKFLSSILSIFSNKQNPFFPGGVLLVLPLPALRTPDY